MPSDPRRSDEHERPSGPTTSYQSAESPISSLVGSVIAGRYKLRQAIGEGGMGSVYLADQVQPVKRQVALKLIKPGMDSGAVLARFETERQALALMDHPNIAKVFDAGTTECGRPFFVMELVRGTPLTEYCDARRQPLNERLTLFRQICSAVQHAHQKGIIHRDLKPSNIMVETHEGQAVPKVIDFGLAKATSGMQIGDHTVFSAIGTVAGTPLYMAPEQASFNALDIDTRADIYALGAILYELLTGSTPIKRDTLVKAAVDELLRLIREVDPPTPSSRLSSSDALPSIAATRQIEPSRLSRFVRGDLDWIVMKALAKERQDRYDSAAALARDIERFLNHDPVSAGPPSALYRLRKFVRRNRVQVLAASLVFLAMIAGIVGTSLGLFEANRQKAIADARRSEAEARLTQRDKANEILASVFKDLNPRSAERAGKPLAALLGERLDKATAELEGQSVSDPLSVARMQQTLAEAQYGLGYYDKAIDLDTRACQTFSATLGPDHRDTLACTSDLATALQEAGQGDKSIALLEDALARGKAKLGADDKITLSLMNNLGLFESYKGNGDRAIVLIGEALTRRTATLGRSDPETLDAINNLALAYQQTGQLPKALELFEEGLTLTRARLGADHPDTINSMANLAMACRDAGKFDEGIALMGQTLDLSRKKLGPDHPETLNNMINLARCLRSAERLDRAIAIFEEALPLTRAKYGADNRRTLGLMNNLSGAYGDAEMYDKSVPLLEETVAISKAVLGASNGNTLISAINLGGAYRLIGKNDRALRLLEESLTLAKTKFSIDHPTVAHAMNTLAPVYSELGQHDKALPLLEQSLASRQAKLGALNPATLASMKTLAIASEAAGRFDKSQTLWREIADIEKRKSGTDSLPYATSRAALGRCLLIQAQWSEAESVLREVLKVRRSREPDAWTTFNSESMLGEALLGQKNFVNGEPLLRDGFAGMNERAKKMRAKDRVRLAEALDRLIRWASLTNHPDELKSFTAKREALKGTLPTPAVAAGAKL